MNICRVWRFLAMVGVVLNGAAAESLTIYDDATTWGLTSTKPPSKGKVRSTGKGETDMKNTNNVKSGACSIFIDGSTIELTAPAPISASGYDRIEFWAHGGPLGTGSKRYAIVVDGNPATFGRIQRFLWIASGRWEKYSVPLRFLGNPATIASIKFLPDGLYASIYVDDVKLTTGPHETFMLEPAFPEILCDGGFEEGANGQYTMNAMVESVTSPVHSGKFALRVYDRPLGKGLGWTGPDFEPTPFYHKIGPGWYEVSAWFRLPEGATNKAKCGMGTEIIYSDPEDEKHGKAEVIGKSTAEVGTEWTQIKYQTRLKTGKYTSVFKVLPVADENTPEYFLDDVSFRKIPAPDGSDQGEAVSTLSHVDVKASIGDIAKSFTLEIFGKKGAGDGEFYFPRGLACDKTGRLLVADTDNHRIQIREPSGEWRSLGKKGVGDGELSCPRTIAATADETFYVVDRGNHRVVKVAGSKWATLYDAGKFDYAAAADKKRTKPLCLEGIAYSPSLGLLAVEFWRSSIQCLSEAGEWKMLVPSEKSRREGGPLITAGMSEGKTDLPQGICADAKGNIFVADTGNHRIQMRDKDGKWSVLAGVSPETTKCFAPEYLGASSLPGQFNLPKAVAVDAKGNLYVADSGNHRIQIRDANTGAWTAFGKQGSGVGEFDGPEAIAVDEKGTVYIADTRNHRIVKLQGRK